MERARELDPLSALIITDNAWPHFFPRDYDKSIDYFNKALEVDTTFMVSYWVRGWAHQEKGNLSDAIADYKKAQSLEDDVTVKSFLANAYALSGKRNEAQQILNELLEIRRQRYVSGASIAAVYAGLGNKEQTFMWLDKAFEEHEEWMVWLKYDSRFGSLRSDPHFNDLLRRVGLPQ